MLITALSLAFALDRTWYADSDGDGHGNPYVHTVAEAAHAPAGYVDTGDDCDDAVAAVSPDAAESCNGVDDDCDGDVDGTAVCGVDTWNWNGHAYLLITSASTWQDALTTCEGYGYTLVTIASDAEDLALDGAVDARSTGKWWTGYNDVEYEGQWVWADGSDTIYTNWYPGEPNNGLGGGEEDCVPLNRFEPARGWNDEPCSDTDAFVCESGVVVTTYEDADGDGFGDPRGTTHHASDVTEGYAANAADCDDTDDTVNPGARETWYDGVDSDCDGHDDTDADYDGHAAASAGGDDCADDDSTVHPGADDVWYDGVDADCSGSDYDQDGDGADALVGGGDDCDDTDAAIGPASVDLPDDGIDQDCDGADATGVAPDTGDSGDTGAADTASGDTGADPEDSGAAAAGGEDCGCGSDTPLTVSLVAGAVLVLAARRARGSRTHQPPGTTHSP